MWQTFTTKPPPIWRHHRVRGTKARGQAARPPLCSSCSSVTGRPPIKWTARQRDVHQLGKEKQEREELLRSKTTPTSSQCGAAHGEGVLQVRRGGPQQKGKAPDAPSRRGRDRGGPARRTQKRKSDGDPRWGPRLLFRLKQTTIRRFEQSGQRSHTASTLSDSQGLRETQGARLGSYCKI